MKIEVRALTSNQEVMNRARVTIWKNELEKEPSETFMNNMYMAKHSPIRDKWFSIHVEGIPYWLSTHFVRHSVGYTPYVSTQRDDRLEYKEDRGSRGQGELVNMDITLNAESFMNVSAKRLCGQAHIKAQEFWKAVLKELKEIDKPLYDHCVPNCIHLGFCPEMKSCGRTESEKYQMGRTQYVRNYPKIK